MKTSVIEVPDMLSVLTVDEVEARFEEVPGVESATVNFAAGKVTVRFDETLLKVADINVFVHQRGQKPANETQPEHESGIKADQETVAEPAPGAPTPPATPPPPAALKAEPASAAMPAPTVPAARGKADEPATDAPPSPAAG